MMPAQPDAACPTVGKKARNGAPVAAQDGGGDVGLRVGLQAFDQMLDEPGWGQGGVALQVHDDVVAGKLCGHFGTALGAVAGVRRGHHHLGPEAAGVVGDAGVIGGDDDAVDAVHRNRGVPAAADQGFPAVRTAQADKGFARVAGRRIARGDGDEGLHFSTTPGAKAMKNGLSQPGLP